MFKPDPDPNETPDPDPQPWYLVPMDQVRVHFWTEITT